MTYYNEEVRMFYYDGGSMTRRLEDGSVWSGVPTAEQLTEWGYRPMNENENENENTEEELRAQRMQEILQELAATDYLSLKAFEGEDMSEHEGWKERRAALRQEYRELEADTATMSQPTGEEEEEE